MILNDELWDKALIYLRIRSRLAYDAYMLQEESNLHGAVAYTKAGIDKETFYGRLKMARRFLGEYFNLWGMDDLVLFQGRVVPFKQKMWILRLFPPAR